MQDRDLYDLLERTSDAAFAVTDNGDICSWNASAEELVGFHRDQAIGKTCFQLFQGRDTLGALTCTENCRVRDCAVHHAAIPDFDLEGQYPRRRTYLGECLDLGFRGSEERAPQDCPPRAQYREPETRRVGRSTNGVGVEGARPDL